MYLTRLIYASKVKEGLSRDDVSSILETAKKNNPKHGVTGVLIFSDKYFLQALEGGREKVNIIYHKILNDDRHYDPVLIDYAEVDERMFEE